MSHLRAASAGLRVEELSLRHASAPSGCSLLSELESRGLGLHISSGFCRRFPIRPGFDLTLYDFTMSGGFPEGGTMSPGLMVTVLLDGAGQGSLSNQEGGGLGPPVQYRGGTTYLCYGSVPVGGHGRMPPGSRFLAAELCLSLPFLDDIGMGESFRRAGADHPLHHVSAAGVWIGLASTPEAMARDASSLIAEAATDGRQDLLVEKGSLDILTGAMALMRQPGPQLAWGGRDDAKLKAARGAIRADPAQGWTIAILARHVGLNEKKLKAGFRLRFGTSVNAFLQEVRMQVAHQMLSQRRSSVTEAALAVGYANPSHFALLFRRRYGVAPSSILNA